MRSVAPSVLSLFMLARTPAPAVAWAPAPAAIRVVRPVLMVASVGTPLPYRATAHIDARRSDEAVVRGRRVRFGPIPGLDKVEVTGVGCDGTVLLHRSYYGIYPVDEWSIVHAKAEVPVLAYGRPVFVDEYHGARDYAGSYYDPADEPGATPPMHEPHAFVREAGRTRDVGRGVVVAWNPGGAVMTKVEINAAGEPASWEDDKATHVRVLDAGRTYDLGEVKCLGHLANGGFAFADGDASGVYRWRSGRLIPWARLLKGWTAVGTDGENGLLARKGTELAILQGRTLHPLRFTPPPEWNDLNWDSATSFRPGGRIVIKAYRGTSATPYAVRLTPR